MGVQDRDWYREHHRKLREQENSKWYQAKLFRGRARSDASSYAPDVKPVGALVQSVIYCFAVFGAVTLLVRAIKWLSG